MIHTDGCSVGSGQCAVRALSNSRAIESLRPVRCVRWCGQKRERERARDTERVLPHVTNNDNNEPLKFSYWSRTLQMILFGAGIHIWTDVQFIVHKMRWTKAREKNVYIPFIGQIPKCCSVFTNLFPVCKFSQLSHSIGSDAFKRITDSDFVCLSSLFFSISLSFSPSRFVPLRSYQCFVDWRRKEKSVKKTQTLKKTWRALNRNSGLLLNYVENRSINRESSLLAVHSGAESQTQNVWPKLKTNRNKQKLFVGVHFFSSSFSHHHLSSTLFKQVIKMKSVWIVEVKEKRLFFFIALKMKVYWNTKPIERQAK